jgi:hypothetical protein
MKATAPPIYCLFIWVMISVLNYAGDRTTKKYDFNDFRKVEVGYGMLLTVTQSSSYEITIDAEEADFEYLKVEKKGATLDIYIDKNYYHKKGDIIINIKMPELTALDLSGGAQGKITMDIKNDFNCELSGGSGLSGSLNCQNIYMEISGGSTVNFKGKGNDFDTDASGGSISYLKDFRVKNVEADLSGGSRLEINLSGTLNVDASGGSRVIYFGSANIGTTDFSGGSGISKGE